MNIGSTNSTQAALNAVENTPDSRAALQMLLLKKSLENQQSAADQMLREMDGKGQNIDIRA